MSEKPEVSVVIPSYNKGQVLPLTLRALQDQVTEGIGFEVIVVDDGSVDHTQQVVGGLALPYPWRCVHQDNKGAAAARNLGASLAKGDILLFLDPDIILDPETLAVHRDAHRKLDRALVTGRVLPMIPNPVGVEDLLFQENFDFGIRELGLPWHCTITQCLSIKRDHFCQLGAFSEDIHRVEDLEFGYRAKMAGFEVRYFPQATGRHNHALDIRQRCKVERWNHQHIAVFFLERPLLVSDMGYLKYKWPADWRSDSPSIVVRKLVRRLLAWQPILATMGMFWNVLSRVNLPQALLRRLYWAIVGSHQLLGLRDGMRTQEPLSPGFREK